MIALVVILIAALGLSILGHFNIWIFTNSYNDNLFILAGIGFILGLFTQTNSSSFASGTSVLYSGKKEQPEQHPGHEKSRLSVLLFLSLMFAVICILSLVLPDIRI